MTLVHLQHRNHDSGHTLLTAIVVTALVALALACYLGIVSSQNQMAARCRFCQLHRSLLTAALLAAAARRGGRADLPTADFVPGRLAGPVATEPVLLLGDGFQSR